MQTFSVQDTIAELLGIRFRSKGLITSPIPSREDLLMEALHSSEVQDYLKYDIITKLIIPKLCIIQDMPSRLIELRDAIPKESSEEYRLVPCINKAIYALTGDRTGITEHVQLLRAGLNEPQEPARVLLAWEVLRFVGEADHLGLLVSYFQQLDRYAFINRLTDAIYGLGLQHHRAGENLLCHDAHFDARPYLACRARIYHYHKSLLDRTGVRECLGSEARQIVKLIESTDETVSCLSMLAALSCDWEGLLDMEKVSPLFRSKLEEGTSSEKGVASFCLGRGT